MSLEKELLQRSSCCELCGAQTDLAALEVSHSPYSGASAQVLACSNCRGQIEGSTELDLNHWRCLNDSMWSQETAVQVMAWRMLKRISSETWAQDLLDMLYLDEDAQAWAQAAVADEDDDTAPTKDCNGAVLQAGDNVTLIKDLVVKGANFTAKRGTMVRGISLTSNPEHIEGRVNGTRIVLVSAFLKKA